MEKRYKRHFESKTLKEAVSVHNKDDAFEAISAGIAFILENAPDNNSYQGYL